MTVILCAALKNRLDPSIIESNRDTFMFFAASWAARNLATRCSGVSPGVAGALVGRDAGCAAGLPVGAGAGAGATGFLGPAGALFGGNRAFGFVAACGGVDVNRVASFGLLGTPLPDMFAQIRVFSNCSASRVGICRRDQLNAVVCLVSRQSLQHRATKKSTHQNLHWANSTFAAQLLDGRASGRIRLRWPELSQLRRLTFWSPTSLTSSFSFLLPRRHTLLRTALEPSAFDNIG